MPSLFDPIEYGRISASSRIVMSPLTRGRATRDHVPTAIMAKYYAQRASAGLIITEATGISREGLGYPYAPGLWTSQQVDGWKVVTEAVHRSGGKIVAQLWHMGRMVHPSFTGGNSAVSASATAPPGYAHTYNGKQRHEQARVLAESEVPRRIDDYRHAAENAISAGFDGVEVHGGNGYLIDQFLRDSSNLRTDSYGGNIQNRIRLLVEVTSAIADAIGADRTGVRLSPNGEAQGINDTDPHSLFPAAAKALGELGIAFLEIREPPSEGAINSTGGGGNRGVSEVSPVAPAMRAAFGGTVILNSDFDRARAEAAIESGAADAISFGRLFVSNPDLPRRFRDGLRMSAIHESTLYTNEAEGYCDYPAFDDSVV
jgi:N-ethylmaleimide reductase